MKVCLRWRRAAGYCFFDTNERWDLLARGFVETAWRGDSLRRLGEVISPSREEGGGL